MAAEGATEAAESIDASCKSIVGYAFARGSDVVELVVSPDRPQAVGQLLRRVASDALERDERAVRLFQPALPGCVWDPSQPIARSAKDVPPAGPRHPRQFVKVLDPVAFLQCSAAGLAGRTGEVAHGSCLNLRLDRIRVSVELGTDQACVHAGRPSRHWVRASGAGVSALLLGCPTLDRAVGNGSVEIRDDATGTLVRHVFPPQALWRSTLDDLPSLVG